jgi:hypothetical protein
MKRYDQKQMLATPERVDSPKEELTEWQATLQREWKERRHRFARIALELKIIERIPRTLGEWKSKLWNLGLDLHKDANDQEMEEQLIACATTKRKPTKRISPKVSLEVAMIRLTGSHDVIGWSAARWHIELGEKYSLAAIKRSETWKRLQILRAREREERRAKFRK